MRSAGPFAGHVRAALSQHVVQSTTTKSVRTDTVVRPQRADFVVGRVTSRCRALSAQCHFDVDDGGAVDGLDRPDSDAQSGDLPNQDRVKPQRVWTIG